MQSTIDHIYAAVIAHAQEGQQAAPRLGIAVQTLDGRCFASGDADTKFSLRNLSDLFSLTVALGKLGDALWTRVGRNPSGNPSDPMLQLSYEQGIPRNPFTQAGAMVIADAMLSGHRPGEAIGEILRFVRFLADDEDIAIDPSESSSFALSAKDAALAKYMQAIGSFAHGQDKVLRLYAHQSAIAMSCRQLARAGVFLANDGASPSTGLQVVSKKRAHTICALMMTCGYDQADLALSIGLPCKSGRGGGILGIVPGEGSIAIWSPDVNGHGTSVLGLAALKEIAQTAGWSVFARASAFAQRMPDPKPVPAN